MFKNLWVNLSRNQKIGIMIVLQVVFLGLIAGVVNQAMQPPENVEVVNESETRVPEDRWNGIKNEIWHLVENNVSDLTKANIDDAVIRDGTYEESFENDITTATFLLDIDSLRQTYKVTVSWSDKVELYDAVEINCPPKDQMKYPETVCYGMYNNTYSLDLYLPYAEYPDNNNSEETEPVAPNYIIHGDEDARIIEITVSACDAERYKKEAMGYLSSTPIKISGYLINYEVNNVNVKCQ